MIRFILHVIILGLFLTQSLSLFSKTENKLFYDAVRAEATGDLPLAVSLYEETATIRKSPNLYGNLANLYCKTEKYGKAVLNYRRALLLDPANRIIKSNLDYALKIANLDSKNSNFSSYLNSSSVDFWIISLSALFWVGALILAFLFFLGWPMIRLLVPTLIWCSLLGFIMWMVDMCSENRDLLKRELIVLATDLNDGNSSVRVPLRRFAGTGSSANTYVLPGESLWLTLADDSLPQTHQSKGEKLWYLVHSKNNIKKGWVQKDSFGFLIPGEQEKRNN